MMAQGHFISTILNISSQPPSVAFISAGARWPPFLSCPMNQSPHFMLTCCTCRPLDECARQKSDETWWKWGVTDNRFSSCKAVPLYRMARKVRYGAAQKPTQARACPLSLAAVCEVVIHLSRWSSVYNPQQQTRVVCMTHVARCCFSRLTSLHNKVFQVFTKGQHGWRKADEAEDGTKHAHHRGEETDYVTTKKLKGAQYPSLSNPYCNNPTPDHSLVEKDTKATIMPNLSHLDSVSQRRWWKAKKKSLASIYIIYAKKRIHYGPFAIRRNGRS